MTDREGFVAKRDALRRALRAAREKTATRKEWRWAALALLEDQRDELGRELTTLEMELRSFEASVEQVTEALRMAEQEAAAAKAHLRDLKIEHALKSGFAHKRQGATEEGSRPSASQPAAGTAGGASSLSAKRVPFAIASYIAVLFAVGYLTRDSGTESMRDVVVTAKRQVEVDFRGIEFNMRFLQLAISVPGHACLRCKEPACEDLEVGDRLAQVTYRSCNSAPCLCVVRYAKAPEDQR